MGGMTEPAGYGAECRGGPLWLASARRDPSVRHVGHGGPTPPYFAALQSRAESLPGLRSGFLS